MPALGIDIGGTSVKACLLDGGQAQWTRSGVYSNPSRDRLALAIAEVAQMLEVQSSVSVGLCLPGRRSAAGDSIEISINLPCLEGWPFEDLLACGLGFEPSGYAVLSDVQAAGEDCIHTHKCTGRTAIIAIGTGVGLCVFDERVPVGIGDSGIGHLGMMDMGRLGEADVIAPDGSRNILESYIGARAIAKQFPNQKQSQLPEAIAGLSMDEPTMIAVVRMIRIVHAIYVPDQIVLMGGIGIALSPRETEIKAVVNDGLTSMARADWKLMFGENAYHAATGAARSVLV